LIRSGLAFSRQNNLVLQAAYPQPQDRVEMKIDHIINDRQRMFGRHTFMDSVYSKPNYWAISPIRAAAIR